MPINTLDNHKYTFLLDDVIQTLANEDTTEVLLGFTPTDYKHYQYKEISEGETLYLPKDMASLFEKNKLTFLLLSHA